MAVLTLSEVRTLLRLQPQDDNALIETLIPMVEDDLKTICHRTFTDSEGAESWPPGIKPVAAKMVAFLITSGLGTGQAQQTPGEFVFQFGSGHGYTADIAEALRRFTYQSTVRGSVDLDKWTYYGQQDPRGREPK